MHFSMLIKRKDLWLLGTCCTFLMLASFKLNLWPLLHFRNNPSKLGLISPKTKIISPSGKELASLFEGLPVDPLISLNDMLGGKRHFPECGRTKQGVLRRLLDGINAYADTTCSAGSCGGTYWYDITAYCNTGGPCSGSYPYTSRDRILGDPNNGTQRTGDNCGTDAACGCAESTCPNGPP